MVFYLMIFQVHHVLVLYAEGKSIETKYEFSSHETTEETTMHKFNVSNILEQNWIKIFECLKDISPREKKRRSVPRSRFVTLETVLDQPDSD